MNNNYLSTGSPQRDSGIYASPGGMNVSTLSGNNKSGILKQAGNNIFNV